MSTLLVAVLLLYSQFKKSRDQSEMSGMDRFLYYGIAVASVGLAVANDLRVSVPLVVDVLKPGLDTWVESLLGKG